MRKKKKDKKAEEASNTAILASVSEEMAQPRMAQSARIATDKQINARDGKSVWCEIPPTPLWFGMVREMIQVKRIEGWDRSDCAWVFIPSGPPLGNTMDEMMLNFRAQRDKEFESHVCTKYPRTQLPQELNNSN